MPQIVTIILTIIAPIILIAGLGALLDKTKVIEVRSLSRVIIYLASPSLAFYGIANSSINRGELGRLAFFGLALLVGMTVFSWLVSVGTGMNRVTGSAFLLSTSLINGINYGVPVNEFAFGQPGLERAIVLGILAALYANTAGIFLASSGKASIAQAVRNVFSVPMPYAALLGLAVNLYDLPIPTLVTRSTGILGNAAVPLMLVMLGIQLSRASLQGQWRVMLGASAVRLLGGAAIGFGLAFVLGLEGVTRQTAIVEAAMPTAVVAGVLATEFNSDAELVGGTIGLSTLLSLVTLPFIILLVQ